MKKGSGETWGNLRTYAWEPLSIPLEVTFL